MLFPSGVQPLRLGRFLQFSVAQALEVSRCYLHRVSSFLRGACCGRAVCVCQKLTNGRFGGPYFRTEKKEGGGGTVTYCKYRFAIFSALRFTCTHMRTLTERGSERSRGKGTGLH